MTDSMRLDGPHEDRTHSSPNDAVSMEAALMIDPSDVSARIERFILD
mgnify:CR=1 FL=1